MNYQHKTQWSELLIMTGMAGLLLAGCTSTHMQSQRTPTGMATPPVRNMMVVGVDARPQVREAFENRVVIFLREHGVSGTASCSKFSLDQVKGDTAQVRQRLQAAGAESVLFVRVTDQGDFVKGAPASLGSMDMAAVDESRYNALTQPGGEVDTDFRLGARLYRVSDGAVVWSGLLDTVMSEDEDPTVFLQNAAKTIVDRLAKDKVIP